MSALTHPPPPCTCGHTINFQRSDIFCTKRCVKDPPPLSENCSHWTNPLPWLRTCFMDSPLRYYFNLQEFSKWKRNRDVPWRTRVNTTCSFDWL